MRTDVTSMFFNSSIEGKTATPAWGTSIGQSKQRQCRIDDFKPEIINMLVGMTYKCVSDLSKLNASKGSQKREILICSLFTDIFINNIKIEDSQFVLLLVREHSESHDGRLIISYAPYIEYNGISNQYCIDKMRKALNCKSDGCWFVYDISIKEQSELHFKAVVVDADKPKLYNKTKTSQMRSAEWNALIPSEDLQESPLTQILLQIENGFSLQQIFYGAPGTGKSHTINEVTKGEDVIRTTFHPDTDYSSFVGAYKPTTIEETVMTVIGTKAVPVEDADGNERKESKIIYEFVAQSFLQAYIAAWKKYADSENDEPKKQFLVIEEINRGNCAQIFGDLFQLLDRNDYGFSEYPIKADADMKKQLKKVFKGLDIPQKDSINAMYEGRDVVKEVLDGDLLLLPNNLYIWATMNTSDQSLFPIDSAFKRRWDWTYIPISNANKGWTIKIGDTHYDWWQFVERINDLIGRTTNSEDKKLGYFFCKAKDGEICAETFVGKVIFYLWNDVFKDYDFCDQVFNDANGNKLTFDKFYTAEGNNSKVIEEKVELFLKNLGLETSVQQENMDENIDSKIIIKVNDKDVTKVNAIPYTAIEEYVKLHPEMSAQEVVDIWKPFKKCSMRSWIVCNKEERDEMDQRYANYSYEIKCADGNSLWVNKDGWMHHPENKNLRDTVSEFIEAVNGADLGITITETTI